jgi:mRNA-degrading endonuclease RelE of RelBE toxin-antitoxin system
MSFNLTFAPTADRSFSRLPREIQLRFNHLFAQLERDPRARSRRVDAHQLYGYQNVWTLRVPPYRGIYALDGQEVVMIVFGHRDVVYSLLHHLLPPERQTVSKAGLDRIR